MVCPGCLGDKMVAHTWNHGGPMTVRVRCPQCNGKGCGSGRDVNEDDAKGARYIRSIEEYLAAGGKWD